MIAIKRFLLVLLLGTTLPNASVLAADGVRIEPAIQKVYLNNEGVPQADIQKVVITNSSPLELTFTLRAVEFTNIDKSGGNIFLGQSLSEGAFTKANWIHIPETQILLIPGESKEINFTFKEIKSLFPGAHYGAIIFETTRPPGEEDKNPSKIFLRQIATSLLYVNKEASENQKITVQSIERFRTFPRLIDSLVVTFANEGNAFVEPRGFVEVSHFFGINRDRITLNEGAKTLFPGQIRQIEAKFEKVSYFFPGRYTFTVSYRVDSGDYQEESISYWYWEPIGLFLAALILVLLVWVAYHRTRGLIGTKKSL